MKNLEDYTVRELREMFPLVSGRKKADIIMNIEAIQDEDRFHGFEGNDVEVSYVDSDDSVKDVVSVPITRSKRVHIDPWGGNI